MARYDVIVVGGGHNGLVAAAYLAKSGLRTAVVEKSRYLGGCVRTAELFPNFKINLYSLEQYLIRSTPIISDLDLGRYGLKYYDIDPTIFAPFRDKKFMVFFKNVEKTIKLIESFSIHDARAYRRFVQDFGMLNELLGSVSLSAPPSMVKLTGSFQNMKSERLSQILSCSAKQILDETFETEYVKVPIAFLGPAAIGLRPSQRGTGWTAGWHLSARKLSRPYGGSGALISALAKMLASSNCQFFLGSEAEKITISGGKATGVELKGGRKIESKIVLAACDPKQTFLRLVGEHHLDSRFVLNVKRIKISNGIAMKVDYALDGAPKYVCNPVLGINECHQAAGFISPSVESLDKAYDEYNQGRNPKEPGLMVSIPSSTDPSLAPPGRHVLSLETRYTPCKLSNGKDWDEIKEQEGDRLLEIYSEYASNIKNIVLHKYVASPVDWERELNLPLGNFFHVDMSIDQMFDNRPVAETSNYKTPIEGLYITGAGTHPGGGVSGLPGRNAAHTMILDLKSRN